MLRSYKAILKGKQLEWVGEKPDSLHKVLNVKVTVLDDLTGLDLKTTRQKMGKILDKIAQHKHLETVIKDPVAWQRKIREDRNLPEREN